MHSPAATGARRGPVRVRGPQESAGELYWTSRQLSFELTRRAGPQSCETKSEAPQLKRARRGRTPELAPQGMKTGGSGAMFNTGAAARGGSPHKFGDQRYASSSCGAGVFETSARARRPDAARAARRPQRSARRARAAAAPPSNEDAHMRNRETTQVPHRRRGGRPLQALRGPRFCHVGPQGRATTGGHVLRREGE